ncbi:MAG: beta-ketoacyl synthase N-terminal-like domain-containing protein [Bryobacteraceae bacterium]
MNFEAVITGAAGIFPGQRGPQPLEGFWRDVRQAQPARLSSLERRWGLTREQYYSAKPGTEYRTYLDVAYTISPESGCDSDVGLGAAVVRDLLSKGKEPDKRRTGLCLATLWTEQEYLRADTEYVITGEKPAGLSAAARDVQAGALAAALGLEGPAIAVDTACASSLYAIDAAMGLIDTGAADSVVVIGLNSHIPPFLYLGFSKLTALSPRGRILPFSQDASGIIISEAVAAILVEPRDRAERSGRRPLASIRGLGLSADGGEQSVFAPGPRGQHLAYERAYKTFDPSQIAYVEAHGTATVLGDNTEIDSLDRFFGEHMRGRKMPIGSAKALIGHSLGTAGLVSVVKALRMIEDGVIPPHIPVEPNARLERSCLRLPAAAEPWPDALPVRAVGVSSFGFGGANAHLVLAQPMAVPVSETRRPAQWRPLAIGDAAGTLGPAHGHENLRAMFAEPPQKAATFPTQRFWREGEHGVAATGHFLPGDLELEGQGQRMGPNGLRRMDPFQRLTIEQARAVLADCPEPSQDVGIVCCSNLGGETGVQLSRHFSAQLTGRFDYRERYADFKPWLEAIASSLPSLASGFAAYHLGIKGFHETISGDASSFWRLLRLSGYWLEHRCKVLVLTAGRHIKSPLDLSEGIHEPGEGAGALLLRPLEADNDPVAVITGFVPAGDARGIALPECMEICQLDGSTPASQRGEAQKRSGFLNEATGMESILHVLLRPGIGARGIEIRDGARTVAYVLIDKRRELRKHPATPHMPVAVQFQPPAATPIPVAEPSPFLLWQQETELALRTFIRTQAQMSALLSGPTSAPQALTLATLRRDPRNIVLGTPRVGPEGEMAAALLVDENHPYFFDHPLDHVPGILMLEGILQLAELNMGAGEYLQSIDLKFRKFCEKDRPAEMRARPSGPRASTIEVEQDGAVLATCGVETAPIPADIALPRHDTGPGLVRFGDPRMLHKRDPENVLVTEYSPVRGRDAFQCDLLPPADGHILSEGTARHLSMLYILETARQFIMLLAHVHEGIPLDQPMNLIRIKVWQNRPIPRQARLRFECAKQPVQRIGGMVLAELELTLKSGGHTLGGARIKSQVVDKETYLQQRGLVEAER